VEYRKLDAALTAALEEVQDRERPAFTVFVHTERAPEGPEAALMDRLGIGEGTSGRRVFTATLSARGIAELSGQPWVRYLTLSRRLNPRDAE